MTVEVRVTANLQKLVGGKRSVQGEGASVGELLDDLEQRYPGFKEQIVSDGQIQRFVNIYLNDEDIRFLDKLDTQLNEGDVLSILPALAGGAATFARPELLATTDWLAERLDDPSIRIVDCDELAGYQRLHIPGAVGLRVHHYLKDPDNPDHLMPPDMFARVMSEHGIGDEHTVVAYDASGGLYAARLWWALDYYGHPDCKVVDGGFPKWFNEGRPVTRQRPHVDPAHFTVRPGRDCLCLRDEVEAAIDRPDALIWDVRSRGEHTGEKPRQNKYGGHIPGAVHLEWLDLTTRGDAPQLLPPDEMRRRLEAVGITPDKTVLAH